MSSHIITALADGILSIQIDRPDKKNALTVAMYTEMAAAFERAASDSAVRTVLLSGHPHVFTSGNDLADFRDPPPALPEEVRPVHRFMYGIAEFPKPIVAAVTGLAVGIGSTMLLHCDLVYAGQSARFHFPFVNLGVVPEAGSSLLLPALVGYRHAAELLLLGEAISAVKAQDCGMVTEVLADADVFDAAKAAARKLAAKPPAAIRLAKQLMKQGGAAAIRAQMDLENAHFRERLGSPEAAEALRAFAEKRAPDFSRFN